VNATASAQAAAANIQKRRDARRDIFFAAREDMEAPALSESSFPTIMILCQCRQQDGSFKLLKNKEFRIFYCAICAMIMKLRRIISVTL
jgi:hypothetical protein